MKSDHSTLFAELYFRNWRQTGRRNTAVPQPVTPCRCTSSCTFFAFRSRNPAFWLPSSFLAIVTSSVLCASCILLPPYVTFLRSRYSSEFFCCQTPVVYAVTQISRRIWQSVLGWWPQISDSLSTSTSEPPLGVCLVSCWMCNWLSGLRAWSWPLTFLQIMVRTADAFTLLSVTCRFTVYMYEAVKFFRVHWLLLWFMLLERSFSGRLYLLYCHALNGESWILFLTSWLLCIVCRAALWDPWKLWMLVQFDWRDIPMRPESHFFL